MCIAITRNSSLVGGRARAESHPGYWACHALLHNMVAECVNYSATKTGPLDTSHRIPADVGPESNILVHCIFGAYHRSHLIRKNQRSPDVPTLNPIHLKPNLCVCLCVSLFLMHGDSSERIWTKFGTWHRYTIRMVVGLASAGRRLSPRARAPLAVCTPLQIRGRSWTSA